MRRVPLTRFFGGTFVPRTACKSKINDGCKHMPPAPVPQICSYGQKIRQRGRRVCGVPRILELARKGKRPSGPHQAGKAPRSASLLQQVWKSRNRSPCPRLVSERNSSSLPSMPQDSSGGKQTSGKSCLRQLRKTSDRAKMPTGGRHAHKKNVYARLLISFCDGQYVYKSIHLKKLSSSFEV